MGKLKAFVIIAVVVAIMVLIVQTTSQSKMKPKWGTVSLTDEEIHDLVESMAEDAWNEAYGKK